MHIIGLSMPSRPSDQAQHAANHACRVVLILFNLHDLWQDISKPPLGLWGLCH